MRTLPIPAAALEQHIAVLGKTRSGKSSALRLMVEALLEEQKPVCVVDPKGDWWGLKSSADGKSPGFPVVIFGGDHADVPINAHSGAAIAELVATGNRPCIIDLGGWMVGERTRFFVEFASTLFRLSRGARWLVIDEVHNFAPQGKVLDPDAGKMLHWANRLASEGLGKGIQLLAASQRPQKVHKDFVTSCETLVAMRVIHPLDRGAIKDWIDGCPDAEKGREVLASLASMPRGTAWVWSPEIGFGPQKVAFPLFKTYDSFRPHHGAAAPAKLRGWAAVNLDEVRAKLATALEEAKANDPKALKARIAQLEKERAESKAHPIAAIDTAALEAAQQQGFALGVRAGWDEAAAQLVGPLNTVDLAIKGAAEILTGRNLTGAAKSSVYANRKSIDIQPPPAAGPRKVPQRPPVGQAGVVDKPMPRALLTALAQHPNGLTKGQVLTHAGYSSSGSTSTCFAEFVANGWIWSPGPNMVAITEAGRGALGDFDPLPVGAELRRYLLNGSKCSTMEKRLLGVLFTHWPDAIGKGDLLKEAEYASSGSTSTAFARLVTLGYAQAHGSGRLRAGPDLFTD